MEAAGVALSAVGLFGLVSVCLDALDRVDTYRTFGPDAHLMSLCFEADKLRFRRWLQAVGIVNCRLIDTHNQLLQDPAVKPLVYDIVSHMCRIWAAGSGQPSAFDISDLGKADTIPAGSGVCGGSGEDNISKGQKPFNTTRTAQASKRTKIGWALASWRPSRRC